MSDETDAQKAQKLLHDHFTKSRIMKRIFLLVIVVITANSVYTQTADKYIESGLAKSDLQNYSGAIADYSKAIEINPKFADAYYYRGIAKFSLKDYRAAIDDFIQAIKVTPKFAEAFHNLGLAKFSLNDYKGAISDYNKALEIDPKLVIAYYNRGMAKYLAQDNTKGSDEALADLFLAIKLDPNYSAAYYVRGLIKIDLGQKESACSDFKRASELGLSDAADAIKKFCIK